MLQWANVFISFFIIIIAYFFFQKTKPHKNRTPWFILFIAVIMFFIFELSTALFPLLNPIPELKDFFKTLFVGFVLYVFVYEHYLIQNSDTIVIEKKEISNKPEDRLKSKKEHKKK
jgi:amino acid transporter